MNNSDEIIDTLLSRVEEKRAEIKKIERPKWKTNCTFGAESSSNRTNLQTVKDPAVLIGFYAQCLTLQNTWEKSCESLGVMAKCILNGDSVENWMDDIKTRVEQIEINTKKAELASFEEKLNSLISPEKRRAIELQKLSAALG